MPPDAAPLTLTTVPVVTAPPELSISRVVSTPGVPFQLPVGWKRILSPAAMMNALSTLTAGRLIHVVPPSVEYCQVPCSAVAALVVMAMPASVLAVEPAVT